MSGNRFKCKVTGSVNRVRDNTCNTPNIIYIIFCTNYGDQSVRSATDFKARFTIHKSDIKTKRDRCDTVRRFNNKCCDDSNPHIFLQVQLIECV